MASLGFPLKVWFGIPLFDIIRDYPVCRHWEFPLKCVWDTPRTSLGIPLNGVIGDSPLILSLGICLYDVIDDSHLCRFPCMASPSDIVGESPVILYEEFPYMTSLRVPPNGVFGDSLLQP